MNRSAELRRMVHVDNTVRAPQHRDRDRSSLPRSARPFHGFSS
jgi:hypothetical protein